MTYPVSLDPAAPSATGSAGQGDDELRALKQAILDLFGLSASPTSYSGPVINISTDSANLTMRLTNKTGVSLALGDVVAIDTANDSAVALSDVYGSFAQFVVAQATIANNAAGTFCVYGKTKINSVGTVNRGEYVVKSSDTKVSEAWNPATVASPRDGAVIAIALTAASSNQFTGWMLGGTFGPGAVAIGPLTNKTGGTATWNEVYTIDTATNASIALGDTQGHLGPMVSPVLTDRAADATTTVWREGYGALSSTGTINRGEYIRKSATTKTVESTGVAMSATNNPPFGTIGMALADASGGSVLCLLFGYTVPKIHTGEVQNLVVTNNAGAATSQLDIDATILNVESYRLSAVDLTVNIAASGANGLDTGAEASGTWYYAWVIYNINTNTTAGLLSASSTAPTMPSGYTLKRLVGAVRNDGSSNFLPFVQLDDWAYYDASQVLTTTLADAYTDLSAAAVVPPISRLVHLQIKHLAGGGGTAIAYVRRNGASGDAYKVSAVASTQGDGATIVTTDASQVVEYHTTAVNSASVSVEVLGYKLQIAQ